MIRLAELSIQPPEVAVAITQVLKSGRFVKGPKVEEFEEAWAKRCNMKYAVGVSSGAMALELAIQCIYPDKGTVITTTPGTFRAVANAVTRMGHVNKFSEKRPNIYAHHAHDERPDYIPNIEDCSHCHGYEPQGEIAVFSLFPAKILGACGDAGVLVTNNDYFYRKAKDLRNHGSPVGTNARMDEIQAAVLLAKLPYLNQWIARRKQIVEIYDKAFGRTTPGHYHYAYTVPGSSEKRMWLYSLAIESHAFYTDAQISIPLHPYLVKGEIERVIDAVTSL